MEKWITLKDLDKYQEADRKEVEDAMAFSVEQVKRNLPRFTREFPGANSFGNFYEPGPNVDWTTGFWTGEIWLAYENAVTEEDKKMLRQAGECQVDSFLERILKKENVDHHDMGFLYSLSCVAAYKLTGSEKAREAAVRAADQLIGRFQPVGQFIQAWGKWVQKRITGLLLTVC